MRTFYHRLASVVLYTILISSFAFQQQTIHAAEKSVPIIFSTDLFHPPDDADDTFDTATLFAFKEFDIRGVVLDNARGRQVEADAKVEFRQRIGRQPLQQLMHITGRKVKFAAGLSTPLTSATDKGLEQPKEFQGAVELILDVLRESKEQVILFNTGSCRDWAAAFNRDPELFRRKVKAIYCNAGSINDRGNVAQDDFNVTLDAWSFFRMFDFDVPIYWCGTRRKMSEHSPGSLYSTSFWIHQEAVIRSGSLQVQNYFYYALTQQKGDPIEFLDSGPKKVLPAHDRQNSDGGRYMWCTGPLCHAAGRNIYRKGVANFVALQPDVAEKEGLADRKVEVFDFVPVKVTPKDAPKVLNIDFKNAAKDSKLVAFRRPVTDTDYKTVMEVVLMNLMGELGNDNAKANPAKPQKKE